MGKGYPDCAKHTLFAIVSENFYFCETLIELGFFKSKESFWKKNIEKVKYFTSKTKQIQFLYMLSRGRCHGNHANEFGLLS